MQDKPSIFNKKCNNYIHKSLTYIENDTGKTRHFTPVSQEWYNSIYTYNNNYIKNLPASDNNIFKLLKSYFNAQLNLKFLKTKIKKLSQRYWKLSTKKTFVGKGDLKHTNNKVLITFFIYNTNGMFLSSFFKVMTIKFKHLNRINKIFKYYILRGKKNIKNLKNNKKYKFKFLFTSNEFIKKINHKKLYYSYIGKLINELITRLNITNKYLQYSKNLIVNETLTFNDKLILYNNMLDLLENKNLTYISFYNYKLEVLKHYMRGYFKYKLLWKLNKIKFNDTFLFKLIYLVKKIYNKNVEFNFINSKKLHLNSDIYTQVVSLKLRNKNNRLYRILKASLRRIKLPAINLIKEKMVIENYKHKHIGNRIRNNTIYTMIDHDNVNDPLNNLLLNFYPLVDNIKVKNSKIINNKVIRNKSWISLINFVKIYIKHINLRGLKVEAKGRLTRRATASRSVFKLKWKGGLKNVDSSYKRLSTVMLRGFSKSNLQYSIKNSKNRNGAFGIKAWVSSK